MKVFTDDIGLSLARLLFEYKFNVNISSHEKSIHFYYTYS
jgi:hypothetical protein